MRGVLKSLAVVIATATLLIASAEVSWAEPPILSAPEAADRVATGEFVLLDIRTPGEWAESGVAEGAWPVSMHVEDFPKRLQAILQHYEPSQIGLICATGGRSDYIAKILEKNGIAGIADVSEGMFGNATGKGWIARGLPVVSVEDAFARYDAAADAWPQ